MMRYLVLKRSFSTSHIFLDKTVFVKNIAWAASENDLHALFSQQGEVRHCRLITDREAGRSRGFAFIDMEDDAATKAVENLNGYDLKGRALIVFTFDYIYCFSLRW
jgi:RNA recognition motif-containing protein